MMRDADPFQTVIVTFVCGPGYLNVAVVLPIMNSTLGFAGRKLSALT